MLVLVTGARGAIGRHVVALARAAGSRVVGLGHGAWSGSDDLPAIDAWINGGVDADNLVALARQEGTPDVIVHLAGGSLVGASIRHPGEDFRRTVESAQRLLEWQRTDAPAARTVIASSAAVYGDGHAAPISETAPYAPTSPYGTHKAMVELLARSYARQFGLPIAIVRLFSVYGPGLHKQLVWELAGRLSAAERPLVLGGTGEEKRDFVHISDAAALLLAAADLAEPACPTFNGCSGRATSIAELARCVASRFGGAGVTFSGESRPGDPFYLVGDATHSRTRGLVADRPLAEGIAGTVASIVGAGRGKERH